MKEIKKEIPVEVSREILKHCSYDSGVERNIYIKEQERAYLAMVEYVESAKIPEGEKEAILKNVATVFPGNYVRQKVEAESMVKTVLHVQEANK